ncbi:MAG: hypothetical protein HKN30_04330 [Sulfitobacter sp.]|nr:hypothetical protein [Sulfitobacter sp.]
MSTRAVRQVGGYFDPFRPKHYADPGIKTAYSDDFLRAHRTVLERAIPDLCLPAQSDYYSALSSGLDRALSGVGSARGCLKRVAQN